jgi:UDP-2,3-diacylglucosamine hydrolase
VTSHALPEFGAFTAPVNWQTIDFISDLHLAADTPRGFDAWSHFMRTTRANAVFILGDLFEAWVGDDSRHEGFEAQCAEVLSRASSERTVAFMAGNRDFLVGADMLEACGVMPLSDPTVVTAFGQHVLLTHGDALCLADTGYQKFRTVVRSAAWQTSVLARPLAERRVLARSARHESESRHASMPAEWLDLDLGVSVEWMRAAGTPVLVHGHTHRPADQLLQAGCTRHVLSDWDLDQAQTHRAEVLRWTRDRMCRIAPDAAG